MDGWCTRRQLIKGGLAVAAVPLLPAVASAAPRIDVPGIDVPPLPWPAANDIVANTTVPRFPGQSFPITGYGAKNDGKTDNTAAIKKAIDAWAGAGGGHVIVPSGGIRNVYAYKLTVKGDTKFALYVKSNTLRGGFTENINLDSVSGIFARNFVYVTSTHNSQTGSSVPSFGPFTISNCASTKISGKTFDVSGLSNAHVHGLAVSNTKFAGVADTSNTLKYVDNAKFMNVTVNGKPI